MQPARSIFALLTGALLVAGMAGCGASPVVPRPAMLSTGSQEVMPIPTIPRLDDLLGTTEALRRDVPEMRTMASKAAKDPEDAKPPVAGDPINLVLIGTQAEIDGAMLAAGWVHPDPVNPATTVKMGWALLRGTPYPSAPVSDLYLFGRKQDLAWETNSSDPHHRDHCRAWKTTRTTEAGVPIWVMAGTRDVAVEWDHQRHEPTHKIGPDIDTERDFIVQTLVKTGRTRQVTREPGIGDGLPFTGKNGGGDPFRTDGMLAAIVF